MYLIHVHVWKENIEKYNIAFMYYCTKKAYQKRFVNLVLKYRTKLRYYTQELISKFGKFQTSFQCYPFVDFLHSRKADITVHSDNTGLKTPLRYHC